MKKVTLAAIVLALTLPASSVFAQQKMDEMNCLNMKGSKRGLKTLWRDHAGMSRIA